MPRSTVTIARLIPPPDPAPPDVPLLRAFVASNGEAAFEELVRRHGPMVLAVCRRVLGNPHDAEDAFQAVFLVLARKAGTIRGNLAGWLYGVAVRTARGVRVMRDRRRKHESIAANGRAIATAANGDHDLAQVIDEELAKLPEHYREALVLCDLRGLSRKQAAAELGIAEGTLSSRLAVGKKKLAARLASRGLATPAALLPLLAPATLSAALVRSAASVARGAAGPVASAAASVVVKGMLFDQLKAVALAGSILLTAVCGGLAMTGVPGGNDPAPQAAVDPAAKLVDQLGAAEFADREAAAKQLREMGFKAEGALRAGLRSESPEVRDRSAKLLAEIRAVARNALVKQFDPATDAEPDHPVWKRFKTIAGNDAAARTLFTELIADPRRLKLLDDADREPAKVGDLYAKEVQDYYKSVERRNPWGPTPNGPRRPWADELAILYLGTYSETSGKFPRDDVPGDRLEVHLFWSWDDALKTPAAPAVRRVFAEWLALRTNPEVQRISLQKVGRDRVAEALPLLRKILADDKVEPVRRAEAALVIGVMGTRADVAMLRRVAESPLAATAEPYEKWNVILKGQEKLNSLWNDYRFGGKNEAGAWEQAWKEADVRRGDRSVADCAYAAAVKLAGGKPEAMGFLFPRTVTGEKVTDELFFYPSCHGFPSRMTRILTHQNAILFLDTQAKEQKKDPKPDPPVLKLIEQLNAPEFADRESAAKALDALGESALAALREAASRAESPEVRKRAADLARQIEQRTEARINLRLTGHTAHVNGVAFFPDASKILTVGDMTYRIWDAKTGKELGRGEQGSGGYEGGGPAAVSPDGKRIAVRYFVADPANHKFLFGLEGHTAPRNRITYARDGSRILTASEDGTIRLWRPDFEKELRKIDAHMGKKLDAWPMVGNFEPGMKPPERFENRGARDAVFSFDGKRIVSGGDDGTVRIWDANTGAQLLRMTLDKVIVTSVAFLSDDKIVSGGSDGLVRVWDVDTGKELKQFKGHTDWVSALTVTADDSRIVSASHDGTARVWDAATGKELRCFREHTGEVYAVAVAPDGRTAVTGGADKTARVWSLPRPEQIKKEPDPAAKLVEQLGAAEFADREAAAKALREMGLKAEAALRAGLKSENPEVRERAAKALAAIRRDQIQAAFEKVVGNDKAAQELFGKIMSSPRGVEAIKTVLDNPAKADEVYRERTAELMRIAAGFGPVDDNGKASVPTEPDVWAAPPPSLGDVAGWMFLGSLQAGTSAWRRFTHEGWQSRLSSHVPFLPEDDYTSAKPIAAAYADAQSAPLKKLTAAWLAKRRENDMLRAGLTLAIRYDIVDALAAARNLLKDPNTADISSPSLAAAIVLVGLRGTKDDLPLLARHTADDRLFSTFLNLPPGTDLRFGAPPVKDGRDLFCHVRDAAAATMCKLAGKDPADFGFPQFPKTKHPSGAPMSLSSATAIGFKAKADRDAAFEKATEWLKSFEQKEEPKQDVPTRGAKVWPHFVEVVGGGKDDRALFDRIVSNAKNLELLEKGAAGGAELEKLYFGRRDELYNSSRVEVPGRPGVVRSVPIPADDAAAWLLMGTFSGTKAIAANEVSLTFLHPDPVSPSTPFLDLLNAKSPLSAPARKLVAAWLANRGDDAQAYADALPLVLRHDIPGALPTALRLLKDYAESKGRGARPFTLSQVRALALLAIAKYGTKADVPAVDAFLKDANLAATVHRNQPTGAREFTVQVRDAAAVAAVQLRGGDARALGLLGAKPDDSLELGWTGFATQVERDAAHRKVQEWLAGQPKNEEPAVIGEKFWPRFSEVIGKDKASRALFERIVSNAKNRELLEAVTEKPDTASTLYHERWKELNKAAHIPTGPGSSQIVHAPLVESLGWIYLGTFAGTESSPQQSFSLDFLPHMPPAKSAQDELRDVINDKVLSTPMRRLIGTWTAARADTTGRQYGLQAGIAYDIAEVLPAARATLTTKVKDDPYPGNTARVVGIAMLAVGKLGTKDDLALLERYANDETQCALFLHDPPPKPGEPTPPRLIRLPKEGQDTTTQLRDVSAAMRLHMVGQKPEEFGFYWSWPFGAEVGKPNRIGTFHLSAIGFLRAADRDAAHTKAKAWFDKKEEPKKDEPAPGLLQDLVDLDQMRRGEGTDFAAVEKSGEELLKKYPASADRGRIYSTLTVVYSNSGIGKTFARVEKYGRLALEHQKDPVARGMIFSQLASAAEVAVKAGDPLADDPFPVKRKRAAEIVLEGYRELLPLKLPDTAPELPGVMKIGGALGEANPVEAAQLRTQHAAQMKAREEAVFVTDMVHRRDTFARQLKYLYDREPKADDELRKLAEAALKGEKAAAELLQRVAKAK